MNRICVFLSAGLLMASMPSDARLRSLVPSRPSKAPDYFSSWNTQGYCASYDGAATIRLMTEQSMFGDGRLEGWTRFFPSFREDLLFLMDDSWDIPCGTHEGNEQYMGECRLDPGRFPTCTGTPVERLRKLVKKTKDAGWKGLAGWVVAHESSAAPDREDREAYWTTRLRESTQAGMNYWKVDYGREQDNIEWRRMLTRLAREHAPKIVLENDFTYPVIEDCDVFRTYDVEVVTSVPVTLQRVVRLLKYQTHPGNLGLINCEDEPLIAVGLGCVIGVMRHPVNLPLPNGQADHVFPAAARNLKARLDEVDRALKWHRIAEPFAVDNDANIDTCQLTDRWLLAERETWVPGRRPGDILTERAPARISRCMPLPQVECAGEPPYVLASRYPNGSVAVATLERLDHRTWGTPLAKVSVEVENVKALIGVFGDYQELIITYPRPLKAKARILAQDLRGKCPVDISSRVRIEGNRLILPGTLIHEVGTMDGSPGDVSAPGLVLCIK